MGSASLDRRRSAVGWLLALVVLTLYGTIPLSLAGDVLQRPGVVSPHSDLWIGPIVAAFALSGAALTHLRPWNVIGWLLLLSALLQVTNIAASAYSIRALTDPDGSLPLGLVAAWVASWTWLPSLLVVALVLPAVYPTGHPPSRYWTWHVRLTVVAIVVATILLGVAPGAVDDGVAGTRLPWSVPEWAVWVVAAPTGALLAGSAGSVIVGTAWRAVRASAPERQQLLWLLSVVALMVGTVFTEYRLLFGLSYGLVPVAVSIGVLRYRLLGIEVALRRTLLYVPMTVFVALVVGGLTTVLADVVPEGPLPLLVASAVVVVVMLPLAQRLRVVVDRLVLGERADPLTLVDRVAADLEVPHDDPVAAMLEAVASAAGASWAVVRDRTGRLVSQVGTVDDCAAPTTTVGLRHGGDELGALEVGVAPGRPELTGTGRRIAAALAPHLAVVVHARHLADTLERERERVTTATLAERDRLRRDLHDGLGPSLSGIALGLEAAAVAQTSDPASVPALLSRTRAEADSAVMEIRRVVDGLRPATLVLRGLPAAVRDTASMLGLGRPGGVRFSLDADLPPALAPAVEEAAFRIVAEALTNVVRHADATRCAVSLRGGEGALHVVVSDDGRGPLPVNGSGVGIDSMRRRAADLDGRLQVDPVDRVGGVGTVVTAVLPLAAP